MGRQVTYVLLQVLSFWTTITGTISSPKLTQEQFPNYNVTLLYLSTKNGHKAIDTPLHNLYKSNVSTNGPNDIQFTTLPGHDGKEDTMLYNAGMMGYVQNHLITNNVIDSKHGKKSKNDHVNNAVYAKESLISLDSLIKSDILNQSDHDLPALVTLRWGKHSVIKKGRHTDSILADAMLRIKQVLDNFGLTGYCSVGLGSRLPQLMTDITEHTFLNKSGSSRRNYNWEDSKHPVHNLLDRALEEISKTRHCKEPNIDDGLTRKKSKSVLKKLDPDLRMFMSSVVQIIPNLVQTNEDVTELVIHFLCKEIIQITDASLKQCLRDFHIFKNIVSWMNTNDKQRSRREAEDATVSLPWFEEKGDIGRQGEYGSSFGESSYISIEGYDKENSFFFGNEYSSSAGEPHYVIIEDDLKGEDYKWIKVKIAILGALTITAYSLLGLLAFIGLTGGIRGAEGEKGDTGMEGRDGTLGHKGIKGRKGGKGEKGVKGRKGGKGMIGRKGMKSEKGLDGESTKGEKGMKGIKGMKGGKGMGGENGVVGINGMIGENGMIGMMGMAGENGMNGENGMTGVNGAKGEEGMFGDNGMKGNTGMKGDTGVQGENGMEGENGMKGEMGMTGDEGMGGEIGMPGMKGMTGENGMPGENGMDGMIGMEGETNDGMKGEKGCRDGPGNSGGCKRRRRALRKGTDTNSLLDAPQLLDALYRNKEQQMPSPGVSQDLTSEVITAVNFLWREYKSLKGCIKCSLFGFFKQQKNLLLDSYILAGFSHLLGTSESLQLLDDVKEGKKRGIEMRCRRRKTTCDLEYSNNDF